MKKVYTSSNVSLLRNREVFFDANIFIFNFWPTLSKNQRAEKYSKTTKILLQQKTRFLIDFTVVSEVINYALRTEYTKYLQERELTQKDFGFKWYRDSSEGRNAIGDIYQTVRITIGKIFNVVGKCFTQSDIERFLNVEELDFSDKAILSICKENGCVLFTDDADFTNSPIEILTLNKRIINKRKRLYVS